MSYNLPPGVTEGMIPGNDGLKYQTTLRTYKEEGGTCVDIWKCPVCGFQNKEYDCPEESECGNCEEYVKLNYRIMRGKKH